MTSAEQVLTEVRAAIDALARVVYALQRGDHADAGASFQLAHDRMKSAAKSWCKLELQP